MGDLRLCSPEPNGPFPLLRSSSFPSSYWLQAEESTQEIIAQVHPTLVSENRRRLVIDYIQMLIRASLGCEVFPFGSVPLKTYLPDGDIDLTAFGGLNVEEALAKDVFSILEKEDQNIAAEFVVRDVQLIRAEVKLVKCLVQNIVVDISFNQLGGLCTLCFLEKVDRLIDKDHLFKRSIILIKAWCYYESRVLGAHHGLISTYALETLVLYIFNLFHSSLNGPLAVLYKFLDYFSKFDWENYCISLNGPVCITSLPEIVAEMPGNGGGDLLLSNEFLRDCVERFSATPRGSEANSRIFPQKYLNIVDPLKENNNLGRSVSKGNFYRIRSAFTYGARKLGHILSQQEENITDEIRKFFSNTLDRHGSGQRPDVEDPIPVLRHNGYGPAIPFSGTGFEDQSVFESEFRQPGFIMKDCKLEQLGGSTVSAPKDVSRKVVSSASSLEVDLSGVAISDNRLPGDAQVLYKGTDLTISNSSSEPSTPNGDNTSSLTKAPHAPHLYFSSSFAGNGEKRKDFSNQDLAVSSYITKKKVSSGVVETGITVASVSDLGENHVVNDWEAVGLRNRHPTPRSVPVPWHQEDDALTGTDGTPKALNSLSDLGGDFESHIGSLNCGRYWLGCGLSNPVPPLMHSQFQRQTSWDTVTVSHSVQSKRNVFPQSNANGPVFYPINNSPMMARAPFVLEDVPKPRGTGTYFPNTNHYRDRPLAARGKNTAPLMSPRNNGRVGRHFETRSPEISGVGYWEILQAPFQESPKYGCSEVYQGLPRNKTNPSLHQPLPERSKQPGYETEVGQPRSLRLPTTEVVEENRVAVKSYKLKDNEDFPPLSI